jgi:hypothetical protein
MAEEPPLRQLKQLFEVIRERADYALKEIARFEEVKQSMFDVRWTMSDVRKIRTVQLGPFLHFVSFC